MHLGQKSSFIKSALGVKKSIPHLSLGVKTQVPNYIVASSNHSNSSDGIIRNDSNGNNTHREPMLGVKLPHSNVSRNNNNLEKATRIRHPNNTNSKFH